MPEMHKRHIDPFLLRQAGEAKDSQQMHQASLGVDIGCRLHSMQGSMICVFPGVIGGEAVWKVYREGHA